MMDRVQPRIAGTAIVLACIMVLWLLVFAVPRVHERPSAQGLEADLGIMLGAAQLVHAGANPFDRARLYAATDALLDPQNLPITPDQGIVRVGYPPLVYWSLQPLTRVPFVPAAWAWMIAMWGLASAGFLAVLGYLGWRRRAAPLVLFLIAPPVVVEVYHGNILAVVFAGVTCSLLLLRRMPILAGVLLTLAWVKPQVGLPIAALIIAFHAPRPLRTAAGLGIGTGCGLLFTLATTGAASLTDWLSGLVTYAHDVAPQHVVASFSGVYVLWAPLPLRAALTVFGVTAACALTGAAWWRVRRHLPARIEEVAWLPFVWFLATPYAHVNDEMLLVIPILAVLGRDGRRLTEPFPAAAVLLTAASAVPAVWSIVGLLPTAALLAHRSQPRAPADLARHGTVLVLMVLSLVPVALGLPVRKEPILLIAALLCLLFAGEKESALRRPGAPRTEIGSRRLLAHEAAARPHP